MKIYINNRQNDLKIDAKLMKLVVKTTLKAENASTDEIFIHFVDTKTISQLHKEHFQDPTPTDCISFPIDSPEKNYEDFHLLGEIFVCPKTAIDYAKKHQTDPLDETILYVIHGILHLLGYDDINPADRKKMRAAERKVLDALKIKRP